MILSQTISITLGSLTTKYYEKLGYKIPRKLSHYRNKMIVPRGTKIKVKVSDLPKESNLKVLCECDECGKENWIIYQSIGQTEQGKSPLNKKYLCKSCVKVGERNSLYDSSLTENDRKRFRINGITRWKREVMIRDNHTCQKCGSKKRLEVHHINNYKYFKEQRTDINNGITLCFNCHIAKNGKSIHNIYGKYITEKHLRKFLKN